jgi:hypothetical protein
VLGFGQCSRSHFIYPIDGRKLPIYVLSKCT